MDQKEIKIPIPWGHIAAKTWGSEDNQLVLAVHGWQDNASTFDKLIPLLPDTYYYVSIDLPGHGFSSPLQVSIFLHYIDFMPALKLILDALNRKKYIILAHSMGGAACTLFTQLFPNYVTKLLVLDAYHFYTLSPLRYHYHVQCNTNIFVKYANKVKKNVTYTYEEATEKLMNSRLTYISKEAAQVLMRRAVIPVGDGKYKFAVQKDLTYLHRPLISVSAATELVKYQPIKCPHLLILTSSSIHFRYAMKDLHNEYLKNKYFQYHEVEGTHDVHLEHPERISDIISEFLQKTNSKL